MLIAEYCAECVYKISYKDYILAKSTLYSLKSKPPSKLSASINIITTER